MGEVLERGKMTVSLWRHGGREVLRVCAREAVGESCAAAHLRALCEELLANAKERLLPKACARLEALAREGRIRDFLPERYTVELAIPPCRGALCAELSVSHTRGEELLFSHRLATYWTPDGALQRRRPRRMRQK